MDLEKAIFLLLYVDVMLILGNHLCDVNELKSMLSKEFAVKDLNPTKKILGLEIHKDRKFKQMWPS